MGNTSPVLCLSLLLELFPDAKFIHIHRNPYAVFPSTLKMYKKMFPYFYLQQPKVEPIEFILETYKKMYQKFFEEKGLIPKENFIEISYQDLTQSPFATIRKIYTELDLPGFQQSKEDIKAYIASQRNYRVNKHTLSDAMKERITKEWHFTINHWGYSEKS
ncbi:MAG: hypothetical protein GF308_09790 [Candidatus Heimdallarchaeota archaeon]|nr:hypothetical protein [Candidatus Heimdallarchaeota archaeon]